MLHKTYSDWFLGQDDFFVQIRFSAEKTWKTSRTNCSYPGLDDRPGSEGPFGLPDFRPRTSATS